MRKMGEGEELLLIEASMRVLRFSLHAVLVGGCATIALFIATQAAVADGWHNPVLQLPSVQDWLQDAQQAVPDLQDQLQSSTLQAGTGADALKKLTKGKVASKTSKQPQKKGSSKRPLRGGTLQANLNRQQQALLARKANDCLEVLAFMRNDNIYPREFPNFPIEKIPEYRQTAAKLLDVMGPTGSQAIIGRLRHHLMNGFPKRSDIEYHPEYVDVMLAVLGNSLAEGRVSPEDLDSLDQAMQGRKSREVSLLVKKIDKALAEHMDIHALLTWAGKTKSRDRKRQILAQLRTKLADASTSELEAALTNSDVSGQTKALVVNHLRKYLPDQSVPGLLNLMSLEDANLQKYAEAELRKRKPKYAEVKDDVDRLRGFSTSENDRVEAYADWHLANAFQRAPISHCLHWLGQGDDKLNKIVWKQLDGRIARANEEKKAAYAKTTLAALKIEELDRTTQRACLELLSRVKSPSSVGGLLDQLPKLPRELWPDVGDTLQDITGQALGPNEGDGAAEVAVALKRWREWLRAKGG